MQTLLHVTDHPEEAPVAEPQRRTFTQPPPTFLELTPEKQLKFCMNLLRGLSPGPTTVVTTTTPDRSPLRRRLAQRLRRRP